MTYEELNKVQDPIKEKYRQTPEQAMKTLRARGSIGEGISCEVETGKQLAMAGLHTATGICGGQLCSADMLLAKPWSPALESC